jgi:hypothetical protein
MAKFLETFLSKLLDFLNFGRLITIVVPGVILSFCVIMFTGQLLFPEKVIAPKEKSVAVKADKGNPAKSGDQAVAPDTAAKPDEGILFQKQLSKDFNLVTQHLWIVVFFTIILGILVYEMAYGLLSIFPLRVPGIKNNLEDLKNCALSRYDNAADAEPTAVNKFKPNGKDKVYLEYFAPFLKEKFSGDENYYNFLIMEYYRFVEFSVVMPLCAIASTLVAISYWVLFCLRNGCCPYGCELVLIFIAMLVLPALFIVFVSNKVWLFYQKSQYDLILGVSDLMSKGLTLK